MSAIVKKSEARDIPNNTKKPYLGIIGLACTKQCLHRIVAWNYESCKIDEEFAANVEEYKEEVDTDQTKEGIDLWYRGLLLKVIEHRVLG